MYNINLIYLQIKIYFINDLLGLYNVRSPLSIVGDLNSIIYNCNDNRHEG